MSRDPELNRQDAISAACHNAIKAFFDEAETAYREQRSSNDRLALAAALEAIEHQRTADLPDVTAPFSIKDCIVHLRATAEPWRSA